MSKMTSSSYFQDFIDTVNSTAFSSVRPKYVLLIEATPEEIKLLTQPMRFLYNNNNENFYFTRVSDCVFYCFASYNSGPLTKNLQRYLGHTNFILSELCAPPFLNAIANP